MKAKYTQTHCYPFHAQGKTASYSSWSVKSEHNII